MVIDYIQQQQYNLNDLDNYVYIFKFDNPILNYVTDDGTDNSTAININSNGYKIYAEDVTYTVTSAIDNRFYFENELQLTLLEDKDNTHYSLLNELINNNWMVLFKNKQGEVFVMNAEFPIQTTYEYTLSNSNTPNSLVITFKALQNIPTMLYTSKLPSTTILRERPCQYSNNQITKLQMVDMEKAKVRVDNVGFSLTTDSSNIKDIEFNTIQFKDTFDGNTYTQQLQFTIPFNGYKYYFHYNLLEYINNRYYALIYTSNNNTILAGNKQGLFPSYSINNNTITITLTSTYTTYSILSTDNNAIDITPTYTYKGVIGECVNNLYTYTLLKEFDAEDNETGNYYALNGYSFDDYNVVGYYNQFDTRFGIKLVNYNIQCSTLCNIVGLPSSIILAESGITQSFNIQTECMLSFEYPTEAIDLQYNNGILTVTSIANEGTFNIIVTSQDGTRRTIRVVIGNSDIQETTATIYITAEKQTVNIIPSLGYGNVQSITSNNPYITNQQGNGYNVSIEENTSDLNQLNHLFIIKYQDGSTETITIIQDKIYYKYIATENTLCYDNNLYYLNAKYKGYTSTDINIFVDYVQGNLKEENSANCIAYDNITTSSTICYNNYIYNIVDYIKDGVTIKQQMEKTDESCSSSEDVTEEYIINTGISECQDGVAYYVEELYVNGIKVVPTVTRLSNTATGDNSICNVITPTEGFAMYRWVDDGDTYCLDSQSSINCTASTETKEECIGCNKYNVTTYYISPLCTTDKVVDKVEYEMIEEDCPDCDCNAIAFTFEGDSTEFNINGNVYTATSNVTTYSTSSDNTYYSTMNKLGIDNVKGLAYAFQNSTIKEFIQLPDTSNVKNFKSAMSKSKLTKIDDIDFSSAESLEYMFDSCTNLTEANTSNWNLSNVKKLNHLFLKCSGLTSVDASTWDTSNVTSMASMFNGCDALQSLEIENLNTSSVTNMSGMFNGCEHLGWIGVDNWNTSNVKDFSTMFKGCNKVSFLGVSHWNTSSATKMYNMFSGCTELVILDVSRWDTSNVTDMSGMFNNCNKINYLTFNNWNTSKVTAMHQMFQNCHNLPSLDIILFNTSKVKTFNNMFDGCNGLTELNLSNFTTSAATNVQYMFRGCSNLTTLNLSNWELNISYSLTNKYREMFDSCTSLTTLTMKYCNQNTIDLITNALDYANLTEQVTIITE